MIPKINGNPLAQDNNLEPLITVVNRSDGNVTYTLQELNLRRVYTPGESKDLSEKELNALYQMDGGAELLRHYLLVTDEEWVKSHFDAPLEYFWKIDDIRKCLTMDSIELFRETLDYAPRGVIDLIKDQAWRLPLGDLNKINAILETTGFDVLAAIKIMSEKPINQNPQKKERLRKREA